MNSEEIAFLRSVHIPANGMCSHDREFFWPCTVVQLLDEVEELKDRDVTGMQNYLALLAADAVTERRLLRQALRSIRDTYNSDDQVPLTESFLVRFFRTTAKEALGDK